MKTTTLFFVFLVILSVSCQKEKEPCSTPAKFSCHVPVSATPNLNPGIKNVEINRLYYDYSPSGDIIFFGSGTISGICTNSHLLVQYGVFTKNVTQTKEITVWGDATWGDGSYYEDITLLDNQIPGANNYMQTQKSFGLKQAYPTGQAEVNVSINVSFESSGDFTKDRAYFYEHFEYLTVSYDYKVD